MNPTSLETPSEQPFSVEDLQSLQFEWLSHAANLSGVAVLIIDSDMQIRFYDKRVTEILELDTSIDFKNRNLLEIVEQLALRGDFGPGEPDVFINLVKSELSKAVQDDAQKSGTVNFLTPTGRRLQFQWDIEIGGLHMIGCQDITESYIEKHALKVAMDNSNSGYLIYDMETREFKTHGKVRENTFSQNLTDRLINRDAKDNIHIDDYRKMKSLWKSAYKKKESWTAVFRTKDAKGETIWVKAQATPQISESGHITSYIFYYTEVTSQLRIQDELRQAIEQSEKALSAKNAFLGRLSHEIRTPMNAVVGIADALIHHNGNPEIKPKLDLIQTSAEKIIRIVDESLEHTKLAEAKIQLDPHSASPGEAVESVCALWEQKAIENSIDLQCRIDETVPETMIFDSHRFEQCLNNLLSNAVKFSPSGTVHVVVTTIEKNGKNNLVTVVKDSGIGMNEAQLANLFEAYTQADGSISGRFGGTGLGMNITKQLIELMDGNISAKSEPGNGTVIALTLPIRQERRAEERRSTTSGGLIEQMLEDAAPPASEYGALKVLVVDDNTTNHLVVTSLLGTMVKEIDVAENGVEAIQALEDADKSGAQFDVVLMDIHMPIMDGIEATLAIRGSQKDYTNIPIIALTADPQYQQRRLCKNIGMDDALAKPIKLTEVLGALDRVFDGRNTSELAA